MGRSIHRWDWPTQLSGTTVEVEISGQDREGDMKLTVLRVVRDDQCYDGKTCPSLSKTDRDSYVLVGKVVTDQEALTAAGLGVGSGEVAIEVPASLLEG
jgi:hypothetical protein